MTVNRERDYTLITYQGVSLFINLEKTTFEWVEQAKIHRSTNPYSFFNADRNATKSTNSCSVIAICKLGGMSDVLRALRL